MRHKQKMKNEDSSKVYRSYDCNDIENSVNTGEMGLFNAVNNYYDSLYRICIARKSELDSCFAVRLAGNLLEYLKTGEIKLTKDKCLPQTFYDRFVKNYQTQNSGIDDELIEIYTKQCVLMLKKSGIISTEGSRVRIVKRNDNVPLYLEIFEAFWNKNDWDSLFPSSTRAARELKTKRFLFINHILKIRDKTRVESLVNGFFTDTGMAEKNNLFMISFIDFYLLTWFTHFGLIQYRSEDKDKAVYIEVTETGRELLKQLSRETS